VGEKTPKKFIKLRAALVEAEMTFKDLGEYLCLSNGRITARMAGSLPWGLDEMYRIMELLDIPTERLHLYFPKGGLRDAM